MIDNNYSKDMPGQQPYQPLSAFEAVVIKGASPEVIRSAMKEASFAEQDDIWTE